MFYFLFIYLIPKNTICILRRELSIFNMSLLLQHPIKRFFARYCMEDQQVAYEKTLHALNEENEKIKWR